MARRRILTEFRLDKIAAVDRPCQEGALATILKRRDDGADPAASASSTDPIELFAKSFYNMAVTAPEHKEGARSFRALYAEREECQRRSKAYDKIWPLFSALQDSVQSIMADDAIVGSENKLTAIRMSVEQFMNQAAQDIPTAQVELAKVLSSLDKDSAELLKGLIPDPVDERLRKLQEQVDAARLITKFWSVAARLAAAEARRRLKGKKGGRLDRFMLSAAGNEAKRRVVRGIKRGASRLGASAALGVATGSFLGTYSASRNK